MVTLIKLNDIQENDIILNYIKLNNIKLNTQIDEFEKKIKECTNKKSLITLIFEHVTEEEDFMNMFNMICSDKPTDLSEEILFKLVLTNSREHLHELIMRLENNTLQLQELPDEIIVYIIKYYREKKMKDKEVHYKDTLFTRNYNFINYIANINAQKYFIKNYEYDDLVQEAYFGFEQAIADFNGFKKTSFKHFVKLLIDIRYPTLLKRTQTKRSGGFSGNAVSLDGEPYVKNLYQNQNAIKQEEVLYKTLNTYELKRYESPLESLEKKDLYESIINVATDREKEVLELKLKGYQYEEIAHILNLSCKQVDNALFNIRKKIKKMIETNTF